MNKYTDAQRLKAIWDGCSKENHPIDKAMSEEPQPNTYEEFIQGLDRSIDVAIKAGYVVDRIVPINAVVGNDDLAIINVEKAQ